jgi:hypothetical protein
VRPRDGSPEPMYKVDFKFFAQKFAVKMPRGRRGKSPAGAGPEVDSEEDIQSLKRSGKASFGPDEKFADSEDECTFSKLTKETNSSL